MKIVTLSSKDVKKYFEKISQYIYESNMMCDYIKTYSIDDARMKTTEMEKYVANGRAIVVGAIEDEKMVGFIWSYKYPYREDFNRLYASIVHVDKEYRRQSIGAGLISKLEQEAIKLGIKKIYLHSEATSKSVDFYEREGFEKERIQLVKELPMNE